MKDEKSTNLLKKVGHLIEEQPEEEKPEEEKPANPTPAKPENRNRALLIYISLLFGATFILVLVSFLMQQKTSKQTIAEVNANASSALAHAEQLQNENRQLLDDNRLLLEEKENLEQQLSEMDDVRVQYLMEANAAKEEAEKAKADLAAANEALEAEKAASEEKLAAYELLLAAKSCLDQELTPDFEEAMANLAPMADHLDEHAKALYDELTLSLPVEEAE